MTKYKETLEVEISRTGNKEMLCTVCRKNRTKNLWTIYRPVFDGRTAIGFNMTYGTCNSCAIVTIKRSPLAAFYAVERKLHK